MRASKESPGIFFWLLSIFYLKVQANWKETPKGHTLINCDWITDYLRNTCDKNTLESEGSIRRALVPIILYYTKRRHRKLCSSSFAD